MRDSDFDWLARIHYTSACGDQTPTVVIPPAVTRRLTERGYAVVRPPRSGRPDALQVVEATVRGSNHVTRRITPAAGMRALPAVTGGAW